MYGLSRLVVALFIFPPVQIGTRSSQSPCKQPWRCKRPDRALVKVRGALFFTYKHKLIPSPGEGKVEVEGGEALQLYCMLGFTVQHTELHSLA